MTYTTKKSISEKIVGKDLKMLSANTEELKKLKSQVNESTTSKRREDTSMRNITTMLSSQDMTWETPQDFFDKLNDEFHFTLDPCATKETAKCSKYYTKEVDGLKQDWTNEVVFCNPPYGSEIKHWVKKCSEEKALVVMLIPARTDTIYFHDYIYEKTEIRFIKGRLKFGGKQKESGCAPFPSMIVIFNNQI